MARGRKRKFNPLIPSHIDQAALPRGLYWGDGRWYVVEPHPEGGNRRKQTVAYAGARLSELHGIIEERAGKGMRGTLRYLFDRFHESLEFKELATDTQDDYKRYANSIADYLRKDGSKLGSVQVDRITTPVIQRLVEVFAMGRLANGHQPALPATPSKANHLHRYLRRTLAWGMRVGLCRSNPAIGVRQAREAKKHRMPTPAAFDKVLTFARERGSRPPHTKGSCPSYLAPVMVLAYSARLRGIEVCTLNDTHKQPTGIHAQRRKGSRDTLTEWDPEMIEAWDFLTARRTAIWTKKGRSFPVPIKPEDRRLLVEQTGSPMAKSSLDSAWQRFITLAMTEGIITKQERFSLHGLKHRGITDTVGNRGDKQDAAGHVTPATTGRYDHALPVLKPPKRS
ncbi:site-specific integrase [Xanthomonas axonopodis]|uniref:site-specific integrase n=1 Tax=Xanthomonas axonopodis TaxID=53413 RepID=UPI000998A486|nr:integrase [Xanthomonas axonopodis]